jgi:hypothetical protein
LPSINVKIKIYETIWLFLVLYGCETRSVTSREENVLRIFENRKLRRIFVCKRGETIGGWRKFNNKEVHNSYLGLKRPLVLLS